MTYINSMNTIRDRDTDGLLRIRGTGFGTVYVHLHEIGYGESRADMAWTEEFATQLHRRLQKNYGYTGDVRVTDSMKHSDGNWFNGDVPEGWDSEDFLAVTNAMFKGKSDTHTEENKMNEELNNQNTSEFEPQVLALAHYLDCVPDELTLESYEHYGLELYSYGSRDYAIGTDEEADAAARKFIENSVWGFSADFLSSYMPLDSKQIVRLQEDCEGANDGLRAIITDFDRFVSDAIGHYGRGEFLNGWDGEEYEEVLQQSHAPEAQDVRADQVEVLDTYHGFYHDEGYQLFHLPSDAPWVVKSVSRGIGHFNGHVLFNLAQKDGDECSLGHEPSQVVRISRTSKATTYYVYRVN